MSTATPTVHYPTRATHRIAFLVAVVLATLAIGVGVYTLVTNEVPRAVGTATAPAQTADAEGADGTISGGRIP